MLFEPYTRTGMLQRLDADFGEVCGSPAEFASRWIRNRIGFCWVLALGGWMLLIPPSMATAQSTSTAPTAASSPATKTSTAKPPIHHAVHHRHHAKPETATVAPAPVAPPPPLRPAEQPANPATIDFNNGLLTVRAQNSSLVNILVQIQHQTGLVIDGLSHDQRIYGQYGPANVSTTLSALLDGSGYDFVIVGGGNGHAAARLILSAPGSAGGTMTPPAVANNQAAPPADGGDNATPQNADQATSPPDGDQTDPADPTAPPQAKSPQEIFDELRRMHPQ
ncbi:MAG: hypothetical protein WCE63_06440 [Acidobacteriaceae bacterium]